MSPGHVNICVCCFTFHMRSPHGSNTGLLTSSSLTPPIHSDFIPDPNFPTHHDAQQTKWPIEPTRSEAVGV